MDKPNSAPTARPDFNIQTERTLLRLLTEEGLPAMEEMAREPDTFKYLKIFRTMSAEEYTQYLYAKLDQIKNDTGYHWTVWSKTDNSFIGVVNLNPVKGTTRMQIGAQLKRDRWGLGYASELMARLLAFGIHDLKLPAVYGVFEKENKASRRLLEKLDFLFLESYTADGTEWEVHRYIPLQG